MKKLRVWRFDTCFENILEDSITSVKEKDMELHMSCSRGYVNICIGLFYHVFTLESNDAC
jgi:hypothetical protein